MRTTLDIDEDVLLAAKERARFERATLGQVISALARQTLMAPSPPAARRSRGAVESQALARLQALGFSPLPKRPGGKIVTNEMVNRIRDEEGI